MDGPAETLLANDDVRQFYLGMAKEDGEGGGPQSFREVKTYKRRKRWLA